MESKKTSTEQNKNRIMSLLERIKIEKEMRENLEYVIDIITDILFNSLDELLNKTDILEKKSKELEVLDEIVKIINQKFDYDTLLKTLLKQSLLFFEKGEFSCFLLYDNHTHMYRFTAVEGYDFKLLQNASLSYEEVVNRYADQTEKLRDGVFIIRNPANTNNHDPLKNIPVPKSILSMSVILDNQLEGYLLLANFHEQDIFNESDIQKMKRFRDHVVSAISKAKNLTHLENEKKNTQKALLETQIANKQLENAKKKLEEISLTDPLTELRNRRFFDAAIVQEWKRMYREKKSLAVVMCDIDYFKKYNDTYGHQQGDECLRRVAHIIQQSVKRPADIAARYGGEEFVLLLPYTDINGAKCVAENIRTNVHRLQIAHSQSKVDHYITLSLGAFACLPEQQEFSPISLIEMADQALYEAKNTGRNRTAVSFS